MTTEEIEGLTQEDIDFLKESTNKEQAEKNSLNRPFNRFKGVDFEGDVTIGFRKHVPVLNRNKEQIADDDGVLKFQDLVIIKIKNGIMYEALDVIAGNEWEIEVPLSNKANSQIGQMVKDASTHDKSITDIIGFNNKHIRFNDSAKNLNASRPNAEPMPLWWFKPVAIGANAGPTGTESASDPKIDELAIEYADGKTQAQWSKGDKEAGTLGILPYLKENHNISVTNADQQMNLAKGVVLKEAVAAGKLTIDLENVYHLLE